jgi:hypothetical protein
MSIPAGWFEDPHAPDLERWWDGNSWTDHTRPRQTVAAPEAPAQEFPPAWYDDPQNPGVQRWWDGNGWTEYIQSAPAPTPTQGFARPLRASTSQQQVAGPTWSSTPYQPATKPVQKSFRLSAWMAAVPVAVILLITLVVTVYPAVFSNSSSDSSKTTPETSAVAEVSVSDMISVGPPGRIVYVPAADAFDIVEKCSVVEVNALQVGAATDAYLQSQSPGNYASLIASLSAMYGAVARTVDSVGNLRAYTPDGTPVALDFPDNAAAAALMRGHIIRLDEIRVAVQGSSNPDEALPALKKIGFVDVQDFQSYMDTVSTDLVSVTGSDSVGISYVVAMFPECSILEN